MGNLGAHRDMLVGRALEAIVRAGLLRLPDTQIGTLDPAEMRSGLFITDP